MVFVQVDSVLPYNNIKIVSVSCLNFSTKVWSSIFLSTSSSSYFGQTALKDFSVFLALGSFAMPPSSPPSRILALRI